MKDHYLLLTPGPLSTTNAVKERSHAERLVYMGR